MDDLNKNQSDQFDLKRIIINIRRKVSQKNTNIFYKNNKNDINNGNQAVNNIVGACDALLGLVDNLDEVNESLWEEITKIIFEDNNLNDFPDYGKYIVFIYVVAKEIIMMGGGGSPGKAQSAIDKVLKSKTLYDNSNKSFSGIIDTYLKQYDDVWKFAFLEERVYLRSEKRIEGKINKSLVKKKKALDDIEFRISENKEILESVEGNTGFTALFSGLNKYASMLKKELRKTSNEVRNIKYLLFCTPALSMLLSLVVDVEYGFYISIVSIMIVLGLFLKVGLRKEDQYEQLLTKVENRVATAVFHKYRLNEMDESEGKIANEKFHSFIYSEIETSDWNAPDIGEGVLKILKEIKSK